MSVLIKGFSLPLKCDFCPLEYSDGDLFHGCALIFNKRTNDVRAYKRLDDCPLVKLPEKHGRLIDADLLKNEYPHDTDWDYPVNTNRYVCESIDDAPTMIEAEGEP